MPCVIDLFESESESHSDSDSEDTWIKVESSIYDIIPGVLCLGDLTSDLDCPSTEEGNELELKWPNTS